MLRFTRLCRLLPSGSSRPLCPVGWGSSLFPASSGRSRCRTRPGRTTALQGQRGQEWRRNISGTQSLTFKKLLPSSCPPFSTTTFYVVGQERATADEKKKDDQELWTEGKTVREAGARYPEHPLDISRGPGSITSCSPPILRSFYLHFAKPAVIWIMSTNHKDTAESQSYTGRAARLLCPFSEKKEKKNKNSYTFGAISISTTGRQQRTEDKRDKTTGRGAKVRPAWLQITWRQDALHSSCRLQPGALGERKSVTQRKQSEEGGALVRSDTVQQEARNGFRLLSRVEFCMFAL